MEIAQTSNARSRVFGMFGLYRYVLACLVILGHVFQYNLAAACAVFGFFILSGYVVCYILHHRYLHLPHGLLKYAASRLLRIYPLYYLTLIGVLVLMHYQPGAVDTYGKGMVYPAGAGDWFTNLTLFSGRILAGYFDRRVVPVSWSLCIELVFWGLMPILLTWAKLRRVVIPLVLCYFMTTIIAFLPHKAERAVRYYGVAAASMPFCIGWLLFLRKQYAWRVPNLWGFAAVASLVVLLVNAADWFKVPEFEGFYFSLVLHTIIVAWLSQIDVAAAPETLRRLDNWFAALSYPVYLIHMPVFVMLNIIWPGLLASQYFVLCVIASAAAAAVMHALIEVPIEKLRKRFKR